MNLVKWLILAAVFCFSVSSSAAQNLLIYAGAGLIKPMEELKQNFEQKYKVRVNIHYGSSGELFGMIATGKYCDIFIPGAYKYTQDALKNGWIIQKSIKNLVLHIPVIVVPKGNPAHINTLSDLAKPGIKVALGDPKSPAIGKVSKKLLTNLGIYKEVLKNTKVLAPTVNQLLIYVALKQVDAAIIWQDLTAWAENKNKIQIIPISPQNNIIKTIPTAITIACKQKKLAALFNEYISSPEGLKIWEKWGFKPCSK
ncbi:molybdate transport system substrate-binding protein [Desulfonauticus submarinus]|uniref:Molybdate transport system substrate-binding protein n=1 Tax=Desulfonauticus submarinus TaxID=206665 RepID=A0A1H0FH41_9BACT|nr:molybdate ABC transporter substrate-binding protein [Desulfonauticus submarinus]SDN93960.1 molybdate transport system substrate-binding protein [Desulfonauticus submarinus]